MVQVSSISKVPTGTNEAVVAFSNSYQMLVRVVDEHAGRTIILTPSHKLVAISQDMSCKVLAEGVSIR